MKKYDKLTEFILNKLDEANINIGFAKDGSMTYIDDSAEAVVKAIASIISNNARDLADIKDDIELIPRYTIDGAEYIGEIHIEHTESEYGKWVKYSDLEYIKNKLK